MAVNAHLTELEAVNNMLESIGESPVSTLSTGLSEAAVALDVLRRTSRQVQLVGWHCNTWREYKIYPDANDQFPIGVDVLRIKTVNESSRYDVAAELNTDGTKYVLWDNKNHKETWEDGPDYLVVDVVFFKEFVRLTPTLQHYVMMRAGHDYQKHLVSSPVLYEFTKESVEEALLDAQAEDCNEDSSNILEQSPTLVLMTWRNNYGYGQ